MWTRHRRTADREVVAISRSAGGVNVDARARDVGLGQISQVARSRTTEAEISKDIALNRAGDARRKAGCGWRGSIRRNEIVHGGSGGLGDAVGRNCGAIGVHVDGAEGVVVDEDLLGPGGRRIGNLFRERARTTLDQRNRSVKIIGRESPACRTTDQIGRGYANRQVGERNRRRNMAAECGQQILRVGWRCAGTCRGNACAHVDVLGRGGNGHHPRTTVIDLAHRIGNRGARIACGRSNDDIRIECIKELAITIGSIPWTGAAGNREVDDINPVDDRILDACRDGGARASIRRADLVGTQGGARRHARHLRVRCNQVRRWHGRIGHRVSGGGAGRVDAMTGTIRFRGRTIADTGG